MPVLSLLCGRLPVLLVLPVQVWCVRGEEAVLTHGGALRVRHVVHRVVQREFFGNGVVVQRALVQVGVGVVSLQVHRTHGIIGQPRVPSQRRGFINIVFSFTGT